MKVRDIYNGIITMNPDVTKITMSVWNSKGNKIDGDEYNFDVENRLAKYGEEEVLTFKVSSDSRGKFINVSIKLANF